MNRLPLGSDAGAQGDVHGYINTGLHTVSAAQANAGHGQIRWHHINNLGRTLGAEGMSGLWWQLVWVKLPKLDPFQGSRPRHPGKGPKSLRC